MVRSDWTYWLVLLLFDHVTSEWQIEEQSIKEFVQSESTIYTIRSNPSITDHHIIQSIANDTFSNSYTIKWSDHSLTFCIKYRIVGFYCWSSNLRRCFWACCIRIDLFRILHMERDMSVPRGLVRWSISQSERNWTCDDRTVRRVCSCKQLSTSHVASSRLEQISNRLLYRWKDRCCDYERVAFIAIDQTRHRRFPCATK